MLVEVKENCGNSPNKELLRDLIIEAMNGNDEYVIQYLDKDVQITQIGHSTLNGIDQVMVEFEKLKAYTFQHLTIERIVTHGRDAAMNGILIDRYRRVYHFCLFFTLTLGKKRVIKTAKIYILPE